MLIKSLNWYYSLIISANYNWRNHGTKDSYQSQSTCFSRSPHRSVIVPANMSQHEHSELWAALLVSVYPSCFFASTKRSSSASHLLTRATGTALMGLWDVRRRMSCVEKKMLGPPGGLGATRATLLIVWVFQKRAAMIWLRSRGHRTAYWCCRALGSPRCAINKRHRSFTSTQSRGRMRSFVSKVKHTWYSSRWSWYKRRCNLHWTPSRCTSPGHSAESGANGEVIRRYRTMKVWQ